MKNQKQKLNSRYPSVKDIFKSTLPKFFLHAMHELLNKTHAHRYQTQTPIKFPLKNLTANSCGVDSTFVRQFNN